jgi:hypothetical protein
LLYYWPTGSKYDCHDDYFFRSGKITAKNAAVTTLVLFFPQGLITVKSVNHEGIFLKNHSNNDRNILYSSQ